MMDQKIEYNFRFKKRLNLMYVNQFFRSLLAFKCFAIFCDQKCFAISPWKPFDYRYFIFKRCVTHFNVATSSTAYTTVKRLTKREDKFFR